MKAMEQTEFSAYRKPLGRLIYVCEVTGQTQSDEITPVELWNLVVLYGFVE